MLGSFVANSLDFGGVYSKTRSETIARGPIPSTTTRTDGTPSSGSATIVARTALALEYASLRHQSHCPSGVYIVPSQDNLFIWEAVLFVHQGYYAGAVLRLHLTFPNNYPERMPVAQFVTDIFHPLIDQKGYFNLGAHFRPWKPKEHHVYDVLYHIKAAFKKYCLDQFKEADAWNKEAYRYHESTSSFSALAIQSSQLTQSESALYDNEHPSFAGRLIGLTFQKLSPEELDECRRKLGLREWIEEPTER